MNVNHGAQKILLDGKTEADCYHDAGDRGFFSILTDRHGRKKQTSHRLEEMATVIENVDPTQDTWLSQAEFFRPNRRAIYMLRVNLLFVDMDTYRVAWSEGRTPEEQAVSVAWFCTETGIPRPSLIVYSGRGLQIKWLLDRPLPRQALPRWNACQRYLVKGLIDYGADPAAKDVSRVLRLVGTTNSKSGNICRVVHVESDEQGNPVRYNFEYLCESLLPVYRQDIEAERKTRRERLRLTGIAGNGNTSGLKRLSDRQLAWDRLEDLRRIANLRNGIPEGQRMLHLFWRLNFLLHSGATNSQQMYHEAAALAREIDPHWTYESPQLMTLYAKAKAHGEGKTVVFNKERYTPLYTPRNDTLINMFGITDDEQRQLRTIISKDLALERRREREQARRRAAGALEREDYLQSVRVDEKLARERDRERKQTQRRTAGILERDQYLQSVNTKREQARSLRQQGMSIRSIADRMGVSIGAVSGYLKSS